MELSRTDETPLYIQVMQRIRQDIAGGRYAAGDVLPAEPQLCEAYGVSRITVRRAVAELEADGLLEKRHGKGTFVRPPKVTQELVNLDGFTETVRRRGQDPQTTLLELAPAEPADAATADALGLPAGAPVVRLVRLLAVAEAPLTIDTAFFAVDRFPGLAGHLGPDVSVYDLLRRVYGAEPRHARRVINARPAGDREAERLRIRSFEPVFDVEKIVYDAARTPLHRSILVTAAARVSYHLSY